MNTVAQMICESKTEENKYQSKKADGTLANTHAIAFHIPWGTGDVWSENSGGTTCVLRTPKKEIADLFEVGNSYNFEITPAPAETNPAK
jgi:hypothetical protein